ncbi:MAG TPA: DUF4157 domain-containing protein [Chloroflexia bacterium]|nr:DUF4157 domain-containing protein [Chloroflexia bacterium]
MSQDGMRELEDKRLEQVQAETEESNEVAQETPSITPAAGAALLSGPMSGVQRRTIVESVGQTYGNRQVQRMLGTVRRSASSGPDGGPLENDIAQRIQAERSSGQPLDGSVRREMEQTLGHDLSQVRIHTGGSAGELNRELGAKAFTTGRDVFFGDNYSPSDSHLLAHELTHTIQQGMSEEPPSSVGAADTSHEQEADHTADHHVTSGGAGVQREAEEEELQMKREDSIQREAEEEELQMKREDSIQREAEEEELQMKREDSIQREAEEEELQMKREDSIQREAEEEELQMKREDSIQREAEEEEVMA